MKRALVILAATATLGAASPPAPVKPRPPAAISQFSPYPDHCRSIAVASVEGRAPMRRLGELPPAEAYQAVYRTGADGCPDPLLVSDRIRGDR